MTARYEHRSAALDRFLAAHERRAYRLAYVATGNRDDALDVVKDAMFKLVRRYSRREVSAWPALFTRIVQNNLSDCYRRNAVYRKWRQWFGRMQEDEAGEDPLEQVAQPATHQPDAQMCRQRATQSLDAALKKLPLRQQQMFLLRQRERLRQRIRH